ncbi:MAG: methyl-accepting chemotaxis protein [Burkholderiaceae bacterium]
MKVAQRLKMMTAVASVGLLIVSAVGIYGVRAIRTDMLHLTSHVTPVQDAVTRMDAATERVVVDLLTLLQTDDPALIEVTETHSAKELANLKALAAEARRLGADLSFDTGSLETLRARASTLVKAHLQALTSFNEQFDGVQTALERSNNAIAVFRDSLQAVTVTAKDDAHRAREAITGLYGSQRDGMMLIVGLKNVQAILFELDTVDNKFRIGPLRERLAAALQGIERITADTGRVGRLADAVPDHARIRAEFFAEGIGLFDLKASLVGDDRDSLRQYRSQLRKTDRLLDKATDGLTTHVDNLEIEIIRENARIDQALAVTNDPRNLSGGSDALNKAAGALAASLNGLRSATDSNDAAAMANAAIAVIAGMKEHAQRLGTEMTTIHLPDVQATLTPIAAALNGVRARVDLVLRHRREYLQLEADRVRLQRQITEKASGQRQATQAMVSQIRAMQDRTIADANQRTNTSLMLILLIAGVAVAALVVFSFRTIRLISRRLNQALQVAERVASGRLTPVKMVSGDDEIAELLGSLSRMVDMLGKAVGRIRNTSERLRHGIAEISSGNNDLNARTNQQAGSLHETSVSIDHVAKTAAQGAQAAREASELSVGTSNTARAGSIVMKKAVATMQDVHAGAEQISQIISVIDGIAFQTNILALNAAVEAARAGEQGRGFAVVAAEVRSLANKSADAARKINHIISTNVEHVQSGSELVNQAGTNIERIVAEVTRTGELIQQLSDGSDEQSAAVAQVNEAIGFLGEMTQQNAALSKQTSAASLSLVAQAEELDEAVQVFWMEDQPHGSPPASGVT